MPIGGVKRGNVPLREDVITSLQRVALFQGLDAATLDRVIGAANVRTALEGSFFFMQGDPATCLYVLVRGRLRLAQITPEGHQVIMGFCGPGEMFGGLAALGMQVYPVSAEAVEPSEALCWSGEAMAALMLENARLCYNALRLVAARVQELQERLRELTTERVERRIARTLLRLANQLGRRVDEGVLIDVPLARQDLAEMTGCTLYTVSRILSRWETAGLIRSRREQVIICKPHALVTIAEDLPSHCENSA